MSVIDDYLANVPAANRAELQRVRQIVKQTAPKAEEVVSYGMPGFKYNKKYLITFGAFKDHLSVFPGAGAVDNLKQQLQGYTLSKGTIQFTLDKPLPDDLVREMVEHRMKAIESEAK